MYADLMHYSHFFAIVVVGLSVILHYVRCFNAIPSLIVPNLSPQEVLPSIQYEHGDAMEDSDACTNSYAAKWLLC
jgi:hypothetical protein